MRITLGKKAILSLVYIVSLLVGVNFLSSGMIPFLDQNFPNRKEFFQPLHNWKFDVSIFLLIISYLCHFLVKKDVWYTLTEERYIAVSSRLGNINEIANRLLNNKISEEAKEFNVTRIHEKVKEINRLIKNKPCDDFS